MMFCREGKNEGDGTSDDCERPRNKGEKRERLVRKAD